MFFKKNRGVSLVGVTVALGIMGGISVAVMQMSQQSSKSVAKLKLNTDIVFSLSEINAILSDPEKCKLTFATLEPESIVGRVKLEGDTYVEVAGSRKYYISSSADGTGANGYGNSKFKIRSYKLEGNGADAFLNIQIERKAALSAEGASETIARRLNMYVEKSGDSVEMCRTLTDSYPDVWTRGTGSNIFYTDGNVGIGTQEPTEKLDVIGRIRATGKITAYKFFHNSDKRLKKNIEQINNPLEKILSLRGVTFDWRKSDKHDIGFIAQEVQQQIPEIVGYDSGYDILTLDYAKVVPFLVEAIKKQQIEIKALKNKLNNLQ